MINIGDIDLWRRSRKERIMKNLDEWKGLIAEVIEKPKIVYDDKVSVFVEYNHGYVVIENEGPQGLQLQFRKSLDHSDTVITENVVVRGKIVSALAPTNHEDVKKVFAEFVSKL